MPKMVCSVNSITLKNNKDSLESICISSSFYISQIFSLLFYLLKVEFLEEFLACS